MAVDLPAIRQRLIVDDSQLGKLPAGLSRVGGMLGKAVAGGAAIAAGGMAAFAVSGVRAAADVDRGIREVVTLFGETGEAAGALGDELAAGVADLSDEVGVAQDVLVGGLYQAISAGVPKDNAFEFMRVASKAAIAGVTDTETAIDGITTTINAFGLEVDDAEAVSDSMFAAVQGGKTTFEELSASMSNIAPAAAAAGVGFEEVNAGIATLTAAGVPTAQATTQLRAALVGLQKPSEEMDKIFQELGHANAQAAIEAEGMGFALNAVAEAADGDNGKLTTLLGSVEAVGAANIIAGTGAEKFAEEMERQEGAAGSAQTAFETMEQSTSRQMEKLKTNIANVGIELGQELLPAANRVISWATDSLPGAVSAVRSGFETVISVVTTAAEIFDRFRTPILAVAAALLASYIPALIAAATATVVNVAKKVAAWVLLRLEGLKTIATTVAGFATMIARGAAATATFVAQIARQVAAWVLLGVQSLIQAAKVAAAWLIALGPIGIVIAAVVALVALIIANWDKIKRFTVELWTKVREATVAAWNAITAWLRQTWDRLIGFVRDLRTRIVDTIRNAWETAKSVTISIIGAYVRFVTFLPRKVIGAIAALVGMLASKAREAWNAHVNAVRTVVGTLISFVRGIPGRILSGLGRIGSLLTSTGRNLIMGFLDGVRAVAGRIKDAVLAPIRNAVGAVKDFLRIGSPSKLLADLGGDTGEGFAIGLERTTRVVAEAAEDVAGAATRPLPPDLTTGRRGDRTPTAAEIAEMVGGGVTQHFDVKAFDVREAARELGDEMAYSGKLLTAPRG